MTVVRQYFGQCHKSKNFKPGKFRTLRVINGKDKAITEKKIHAKNASCSLTKIDGF